MLLRLVNGVHRRLLGNMKKYTISLVAFFIVLCFLIVSYPQVDHVSYKVMKIDSESTCSKEYENHVTEMRKDLIHKICEKYKMNKAPHKHNYALMFVDEVRKLMYCAVPKASCSNWKYMLLTTSKLFKESPKPLEGINAVHHHHIYPYYGIKVITPNDKKYKDYYKFMFVRHPLERLYSAYKDKFTVYEPYTGYFRNNFGKYIVKTYKQNATEQELNTGKGVLFSEFVDYVIDMANTSKKFEDHWALYYNICWPCNIEYDFIGTFESLLQDSECVIPKITHDDIHLPGAGKVGPSSHRAGVKTNTHQKLEEAYKSISNEKMQQLRNIYKIDCEMFGYNCLELYGSSQK